MVGGLGAGSQGHGDEQAGFGPDGQVGLAAVLAVGAGLVRVSGFGGGGRDHPVRAVPSVMRQRPWRPADPSAAPGTWRITARTAAISWVTVSWVATASSSTVESSARRCRPLSSPVARTTCRTALEDPVLPRRACQPAAEVGQQRRIEAVSFRQACRRPSTTGHTATPAPCQSPIARAVLAARSPRCPDLRRYRRPPVGRGIHVGGHLRREQRTTVLGQERKHAPAGTSSRHFPHTIRTDRLPGPFTDHHSTPARRVRGGTRTPRSSQSSRSDSDITEAGFEDDVGE